MEYKTPRKADVKFINKETGEVVLETTAILSESVIDFRKDNSVELRFTVNDWRNDNDSKEQ
jgi:hypothetical protein